MSKETVVALANNVLEHLVKGGQAPYQIAPFFENEGRNAVRLLTENGLIIFRTDSNSITSGSIADVTPLGEKAYNNGLAKYLFDKETREYEKSDLEFQKLRIDVRNSKRVFNTYWYTFLAAIIAALLSIFNFLNSIFKWIGH